MHCFHNYMITSLPPCCWARSLSVDDETRQPECGRLDNGPMAGKEIDPQRARAARDVVRQHPAMVLVAVSPVLIAAGLVWWLVSPGWAIVLLVAALVAGGWAVLRKR
jgi:hypothetical protein